MKIVQKGFLGKNRENFLTYPLSNIRAIGIKITEGLNPTGARTSGGACGLIRCKREEPYQGLT